MKMQVINTKNAIDECLSHVAFCCEESKAFYCRRTTSKDHLENISNGFPSLLHQISHEEYNPDVQPTSTLLQLETTPPHYIILCNEKVKDANQDKNRGFVVFYFGYSTWKGKVMNVDNISCDTVSAEKILIRAIAEIANKLVLGRIVYQIEGEDTVESFKENYNFDVLNEWLTLQMGQSEIASFLDTINSWDAKLTNDSAKKEVCQDLSLLPINIIHSSIDEILSEMNPALQRRSNKDATFQFRRATENDAKSILNLVQGLAIYEKALEEVEVNESIYQQDGGGDNPFYHCILLERCNPDNCDNDAKEVVGMGCFYFGYSFNKKHERFLFLEDLFIQKQYRGNGFGKAIMYTLAKISQNLFCDRFVWQALDWNTPALNFYDSIGASICQGLQTLRLDKKRIEALRAEN